MKTPAAVLLEIARRMYPDLVFAIITTDNKSIDVVSNAFNAQQVTELVFDALENLRDHGAIKRPAFENPN